MAKPKFIIRLDWTNLDNNDVKSYKIIMKDINHHNYLLDLSFSQINLKNEIDNIKKLIKRLNRKNKYKNDFYLNFETEDQDIKIVYHPISRIGKIFIISNSNESSSKISDSSQTKRRKEKLYILDLSINGLSHKFKCFFENLILE